MDIHLSNWNKLKHQDECYSDDKTNIITLSGGLGSGKSFTLVQKALKLSALNSFAGGLLCPSYKDFKRDIRPLFEDILYGLGLKEYKHYWFNRSDFEYRFIWNKKPLYIFSGEKAIAGPNLAYCLINEFSLIQYDRIKEMLRRVRIKEAPYPQKFLAGTPEDIYGWVEDFVHAQNKVNEENPDHFKLVIADTRDNIHLPDTYRKELETMLDEKSLQIFAEGKIGVRIGSNLFYYSFTDKNISEKAVERNGELIHVGMDFNVGKMTASFSHKVMGENGFEQHIFDEVWLGDDSNTYTMCDYLANKYPKDRMLITCDASGKNRSTAAAKGVQSDVGILRAKGFRVRYKTSNTALRKRQLLVNGLLHNSKIIVHPKCKRVIKDYRFVKQDVSTFEKVKDKDGNLTHHSDGLDYVLDYEYELPGRIKFKIESGER